MKKYISTLLVLVMVFSALTIISPVSVYAEEDDYDFSANIPDDAFEGNYTEFKGNDGSVTRVFDNGSVSTKNADGSVTALDYNGNQYFDDKDGNSTVRTTDCYVATEYKDGRQSVTEPNGKTTTFNKDGIFSESYASFGITVDYDADGAKTGIGFTGSNERIGVDENGEYENGEIKGPNGASFIIKDGEKHAVTPNGTKIDYQESGMYDSENGYTESFSVTSSDGTRNYWNINTTNQRDDSGVFTGQIVSNTGGIDYTDGTKFQYEGVVTLGKDGKPVYINQNALQFTCNDGSTLWRDGNSKAFEYRDPNTGSTVIVDKNGNLTEYKDENGSVWNASYDDNGNVTSANITYPDGAKMVRNPDGTATFTLPDGTKYESDGKGNVTKNGEQIKKDGEWIPGKEQDEKSPDESSQSGNKSSGDQMKEDKKYLESKGYTVGVLTSDMDKFEDMLGADSGSVTGYLSAVGEQADHIIIYYFKTEAQAAKCANEYYVRVGSRIVYGDQYGVITGEGQD